MKKNRNFKTKIISLAMSLCLLCGCFGSYSVSAAGALRGDTNLDGKIDSRDPLNILKHVAEITKLTGQALKNADYTRDSHVNTLDSLAILKKIVGLEENELTMPIATGDFIQPWYCGTWGPKGWGSHFDMLQSAGIDTVILQGTVFRDGNDKFSQIMYDSSYINALPASEKASNISIYSDCLDNMLAAAEEKGIKVFVGLNDSNTWWDESLQKDSNWIDKDAQIAGAVAKEMYDLYKNKYPNAFHGWYFVHEFYTQNKGLEKYWATLMNKTLENLTAIDNENPQNKPLPILFSPFFSSGNPTSPADNGKMWSNFMNTVNFRKGDIFSPQDSFGVSGYSLDYIDKSLKLMKKASDDNGNTVFWVNCENFTQNGPAPVSRFIKQLRIASKYAENIITFSYTHYYDPTTKDDSYDAEYKNYRQDIINGHKNFPDA